ncbi:MAG TPA: hypothetical protein ENN30_01330 [Candidatus Woesearchaeota archaeon]|nr:hypothetical protein [Candidatus Woesearchaeota archaeon]
MVEIQNKGFLLRVVSEKKLDIRLANGDLDGLLGLVFKEVEIKGSMPIEQYGTKQFVVDDSVYVEPRLAGLLYHRLKILHESEGDSQNFVWDEQNMLSSIGSFYNKKGYFVFETSRSSCEFFFNQSIKFHLDQTIINYADSARDESQVSTQSYDDDRSEKDWMWQ